MSNHVRMDGYANFLTYCDKMARYDRTADRNNYTKYRILGSPDLYAVQYHDSGHIIKTATHEEKQQEDIREIDLQGKFKIVRKYPIQIR